MVWQIISQSFPVADYLFRVGIKQQIQHQRMSLLRMSPSLVEHPEHQPLIEM